MSQGGDPSAQPGELEIHETTAAEAIVGQYIPVLDSAGKGAQGNTAPSWAPKGTLGAKPDGDRSVGQSVI